MEAADRKINYLTKAKEAEEYAAETRDTVIRNTWLTIARGYYDLAEFVENKTVRVLPWDQPAQPRSRSSQSLHRN